MVTIIYLLLTIYLFCFCRCAQFYWRIVICICLNVYISRYFNFISWQLLFHLRRRSSKLQKFATNLLEFVSWSVKYVQNKNICCTSSNRTFRSKALFLVLLMKKKNNYACYFWNVAMDFVIGQLGCLFPWWSDGDSNLLKGIDMMFVHSSWFIDR